MSCRIKRKQECIDAEDCKWTVGKGCSPLRSPPRRSPPLRRRSSGCTKFRKNDCLSPCQWIKGTGCRSPQPLRRSRPRTGCSRYRKLDCASPCEWIKGTGCRMSEEEEEEEEEEEKSILQEINDPLTEQEQKSIGRRRSRIGCSKYRKSECKSPCSWVKGRCTAEISLVEEHSFKSVEDLRNEVFEIKTDEMLSDCIRRSKLELNAAQVKAVEHLNVYDRLLVVFGTGVGKTLTAVTAAQCFLDRNPRSKVIVISPKSLLNNFAKEMRNYGAEPDNRYMFLTFSKMLNLMKNGTNILRGNFVIIDEVHVLRNSKAKAFKSILPIMNTCKKRLLMTATPYMNRVKDVYAIISILHGKNIREGKISIESALADKVIYQEKVLVEGLYPKSKEYNIDILMSPEYEEAMVLQIKENLRFASSQTFYHGYRRLVNAIGIDEYISQKMTFIISDLLEKEGEQSVIYTNWIEFGVDPLRDMLYENGISCDSIQGNVSLRERDTIVRAYNNKEIQVLIITDAGAEGLDLKRTENIYILNPPWSPAQMNQIIGRGIRFKSHIDMPVERQLVKIYYLQLVDSMYNRDDEKPASFSGDVLLYRLISRKVLEMNSINDILKRVSI